MTHYELEIGGTQYEAEASSPEEAVGAIKQVHVRSVLDAGVERATHGAVARGNAPAKTLTTADFRRSDEIPRETPLEGEPGGPALSTGSALRAMTIPAIASMAPAAIAAPGAAVASIGAGIAGKVIGGKVGRWAAPELGLDPETGAQIGGLIGALGGAISPQTLVKYLQAGGSPHALLRGLLGAETSAAPATAGKVLPFEAAAAPAPAEAITAQIQQKVADLTRQGLSKGQIAAHISETQGIPKAAAEKMVEMVKEAAIPRAALLPDGQRAMATNLGGPARPYVGPAQVPASDEHLADLLKASIEAYRIR